MADGNCAAMLLFPDSMTEEQALEEVLMGGRNLTKNNELHNEAERTRVCEYSVLATERQTSSHA